MAAADNVIFVDTASNAVTLTLPSPTNGRIFSVKDSTGHAASHNITISQNASEKIDGQNSLVLNSNYCSCELVSDGTNWFTKALSTPGYVEAKATGGAIPANATYGDLDTISLIAGTWNITLNVEIQSNSSTFTSIDFGIGISTHSGNDGSGLSAGDNFIERTGDLSLTFGNTQMSIPSYKVSPTTTTSYYAKAYISNYTAGTPTAGYKLSAIRIG